MSHGVVYYNVGTSHLVRLLLSLLSLRKYYRGPVTILSEQNDSSEICVRIATSVSAEVKEWDCGVPKGKSRQVLAKTRYHLGSPYDITIAIDSDTLILGPIDDLFTQADNAQFCVAQFSNCKSSDCLFADRIRAWQNLLPADIGPALSFGPAINCGVVAFKRNAAFCLDWLQLALPGRNLFIPDEVSCQLTLHRYPHRVVDRQWNCSCKYDDPRKPGTRIIHYHGNKHCRVGLPFYGRIWIQELAKAFDRNTASLRDWMPAGDSFLAKYLDSARQRRSKSERLYTIK